MKLLPLLRRRPAVTAGAAVLAALALALAGCSASAPSVGRMADGQMADVASAALSGTLAAGGSTFQQTFQEEAISGFKAVQPGMTVTYDGVGSGMGRTDLAADSVSFAASDSPVPPAETASFKGRQVLYFPVVTGPVTLSYNLPGIKGLRLSAPVIGAIFDGKIKAWDNAAIQADNPGVALPGTTITLAVRSDSSGTTANFTQFLVDALGGAWPLGTGSTVNWPAGSRAGKGNNGVAQVVQSTPGAIGYVDFATNKALRLSFASVENRDGDFVTPSPATAAAAASQVTLAPDETFSAVWAAGAQSYPITYQSWVLVYQSQDAAKATLLKSWIGFLVGDGQTLLPDLNYAPLPASLQSKAKEQVNKIGST